MTTALRPAGPWPHVIATGLPAVLPAMKQRYGPAMACAAIDEAAVALCGVMWLENEQSCSALPLYTYAAVCLGTSHDTA